MICPKCHSQNLDGARFCNGCGAALPEPPRPQGRKGDPLVGRIIEGKYRLDSKLGTGGMGAVYSATRLLIGDEVAIKILHQDQSDDPQAAGRFRREAQTAARLKHPNAVSVYDFGVTDDGLQYLVMELVEGHSLREVIKQRGRILPAAVAEVAQQLCAALDEAHRHNIIHRDVKPDNIIISSVHGGLRVKMLDFGIAKLRDQAVSNLTQTGSVMGTPHYMSPEQCLGEELDCRSDIYSLGCVLYEMLCGVVPFNAPISTAVVVQHVNQPPPPLLEKNPSIPPEVERIVLRALEKRPEARHASAGELARELLAAVNRPAQARAGYGGSAYEAGPESGAEGDDEATVVRDAVVSTPVAGSVTAGMTPTMHFNRHTGPGQAAPRFTSQPFQAGAEGADTFRRSASRRVMALAVAAVVLASAVGTFVWMSQSGAGGDEDGRGPQAAGATERKAAAEPQPPAGMVYVRGGEFMMGRDDGEVFEGPRHKVTVAPFFLDRHEVTCEEYQRFVMAERRGAPQGWVNGRCPQGAERRPVVGVDWNDAAAYARWAGKRLPTEEEWEFAARGTDGRLYPWGDQWQQGLANADDKSGGMADVGTYKGESPFGALDMVGNAWEWTATDWAAYPGSRLPEKYQQAGDKVIRGGSFENDASSATTTFRLGYPPTKQKYLNTSFRCAKDVTASPGP